LVVRIIEWLGDGIHFISKKMIEYSRIKIDCDYAQSAIFVIFEFAFSE